MYFPFQPANETMSSVSSRQSSAQELPLSKIHQTTDFYWKLIWDRWLSIQLIWKTCLSNAWQSEITHFLALCVRILSQIKVLLRGIKWPTLDWDHLLATTATNHSKKRVTSWHTQWFMWGKHTNVNSVKSHLPKKEIWCHTTEHTQEKGHFPVTHVNRLLPRQVIW